MFFYKYLLFIVLKECRNIRQHFLCFSIISLTHSFSPCLVSRLDAINVRSSLKMWFLKVEGCLAINFERDSSLLNRF